MTLYLVIGHRNSEWKSKLWIRQFLTIGKYYVSETFWLNYIAFTSIACNILSSFSTFLVFCLSAEFCLIFSSPIGLMDLTVNRQLLTSNTNAVTADECAIYREPVEKSPERGFRKEDANSCSIPGISTLCRKRTLGEKLLNPGNSFFHFAF